MRGDVPNRLKMGENEAAWEAVQDYVEQTVADASPEEQPEEIRRLSELAAVAPQAAGPALEQAAYEQYAERAIHGLVSQLEGVRSRSPYAKDSLPADVLIETKDGHRQAYAVIRAQLDDVYRPTRGLRRQLERLAEQAPVLLVTRSGIMNMDGLDRFGPGIYIVPLEPGHMGALRIAVEMLKRGQLTKASD
jgi:hypothetical protein